MGAFEYLSRGERDFVPQPAAAVRWRLLEAAGVSDFIHEWAAWSAGRTRIYRQSIRETRWGICRT